MPTPGKESIAVSAERPKDPPGRAEAVLLALAAGLAPFVIDYRFFWDGLEDAAELPHSAFIQAVAAAALCAACWRAAGSGGFRIRRAGFFLPLLAFLGWCGLSLFWAHNRYEGLEIWLHWLACGAICLYAAHTLRGLRDARLLLGALLWSGFAVSVLGILQHLDVPWATRIPQVLPPASTFGHRNMAVHFVALTLPLAGFAWLYGDRPRSFWAYSIAFWTSCLYLLWTGSRAAVLVVGVEAAAAAVLLWARPLSRAGGLPLGLPKIASGIAGAALFAALAAAGGPHADPGRTDTVRRLSTTWEDLSERDAWQPSSDPRGRRVATGSILLRLAVWRNVLEMARDFPLRGVGLGNAKVLYPAYSRRGAVNPYFGERSTLGNVHNDYLQVLAETGAVGLGLLLWLGWGAFVCFRRLFRDESDPRAQACLLGIGVGGAGLLANAMVSFPLYRAVPPFVLMAYLGVLGGLVPAQDDLHLRFPRWKAAALCGLVLCSTAGLLYWQCRKIVAEYCFSRIAHFRATRQWRMVVVAGLAAHRHNPFRKKVLFPAGNAHLRMGAPERAIPLYETVLSAYPGDISSLLNLALACAHAGRHEESLRHYKRVLEIMPENARAYHGLGSLLMRTGNVEKALPLFRTAVRYAPETARYHLSLGEAALRTGDLRTAEAAFVKAIRLDPRYAERVRSLGVKIDWGDAAQRNSTRM